MTVSRLDEIEARLPIAESIGSECWWCFAPLLAHIGGLVVIL